MAHAGDLPPMGTAFSEDIFTGASLTDVQAATKVWIDRLGQEAGICSAGDIIMCSSPDEWRAAAERKEFTMAVISAVDYLALEEEGVLEPRFVFDYQAGVGSELVLLAKKGSAVKSLNDLAGCPVLISVNYQQNVPVLWLDELLAESGLPAPEIFLGELKQKEKSTSAVLPVFFGRMPACIVTRNSFELITELNPQVGQQMEVIATSPRYVMTLVCMRSGYDSVFIDRLCESLQTLHKQPEANQLLLTFSVRRFCPFEAAHIATVRELFKQANLREDARDSTTSSQEKEPEEVLE
ncbi:MAG: PhnD/SsuA/transferrin family substrate-binding protein [Pontiellaceae bacterium]|nr:PhnD/SsuA/transferrin family substrate-binding protein [Pontiellaceae bacterium]MBN2786634.1 PhnD/SsuA/transferrin family substrate-binding protein [Pontiellaceae bacterium]